ncbi:MAG: TlpA disulfide reductase family protein [Petrimonas sp.]|nr:TlpA disulfide reductase family protein [Petrimonas sp.]
MKHVLYLTLLVFFAVSCNTSQKQNEAKMQAADSVAVTATDSADNDRQYLVKVGDVAPDFEMSFPDGKKIKLSELRGKVVMLQFTASWCGVCRKEMPHIESDIWQKHKDNPQFALYGVDRDEPTEKIKELRDATGVTYPIGFDPEGNIFGLYAEKDAGITRNVIINRDGKIVMLTRLYEEEEFNRMVQLINQLLNS